MLIDTDAALATACQRWRAAPWLAVDTEFVREQTYQAQLCLIQISDGEFAGVVDVLAVDDLAPLLALLYQPDVTTVFHSGSQDLEIFVQLRGAVPAPLFDTQIAAALLGDGEQLGYAALVERRLGVTLDKSLTRTDWSRRPLHPAEIDYAAADVVHLAQLYPMLRDALESCGRLDWLQEECAALTDPSLYETRPQDAWQRLRGLQRLTPSAQQIAARLAAWREAEAAARNRPRKWVLADDALYRIAERQPADLVALEKLQLLPPKTLARHGATLLGLIGEALAQPARPILSTAALDETQKAQLKALRQRLESKAEHLGLPPSMLATRTDLERWLREGETAAIPLRRGWRRRVAADVLATA